MKHFCQGILDGCQGIARVFRVAAMKMGGGLGVLGCCQSITREFQVVARVSGYVVEHSGWLQGVRQLLGHHQEILCGYYGILGGNQETLGFYDVTDNYDMLRACHRALIGNSGWLLWYSGWCLGVMGGCYDALTIFQGVLAGCESILGGCQGILECYQNVVGDRQGDNMSVARTLLGYSGSSQQVTLFNEIPINKV